MKEARSKEGVQKEFEWDNLGINNSFIFGKVMRVIEGKGKK